LTPYSLAPSLQWVQGRPGARQIVWVVDDSPLDIERARRVLANRYTVESFSDGSAMLERLASGSAAAGQAAVAAAPDVLVLDWVMPGVSGIEVCRFLRGGRAPRPELAILLLTTQTQTNDIVEGLAAGANDYLVKPFADPELLARVDALVRWNGLLDRAQKAEASVLQMLEHAPDPLLSVDSQYRITYVNGEAQRALGDGTQVLVGCLLPEVLPTLPMEQVADARRSARPLPDVEIRGQLFSPTIRSVPSDSHAGFTIALRDVTARRQKESRRLDFYSMIAHDLRSPLSAMLMRSDLMLRGRRGVLSAEVITDLRKMDGHMRNLVALINDFLDFARLEEASHKLERLPVDLASLVSEVVDEFKPLVENTRQQIFIEIKGGGVVVLGDRRRLQQVVTNLVANAIKFTPAGGNIIMRASTLRSDGTSGSGATGEGDWCEVIVEDDGLGIPATILPTLFQRYTRAPNTPADVGGTGLGLLIVREIVEAHGGTVGVESTPGQGSRFWFRLPASTAAVALAGASPLAATP
jgi:signal transduction histidine kinase